MKGHLGMKILAVLVVIGGIAMIAGGILLASLGAALQQAAQEGGLLVIPLLPVGAAYAAMAVPLIIIGILFIIFGIYVYKERTWAYILLFVLTVLGLISSVVYFNVWGLLVGILIAAYLFWIRGDFIGSGRAEYREM